MTGETVDALNQLRDHVEDMEGADADRLETGYDGALARFPVAIEDGYTSTIERVRKDMAEIGFAVVQGTQVYDYLKVFVDPIETVVVEDDFVNQNAVPVDRAESWVHLGLDDHYHPTGGYWFPTDLQNDDPEQTGIVDSPDDLPYGEILQFPRDDRLPEVTGGRDYLYDWVVNRVVDDAPFTDDSSDPDYADEDGDPTIERGDA